MLNSSESDCAIHASSGASNGVRAGLALKHAARVCASRGGTFDSENLITDVSGVDSSYGLPIREDSFRGSSMSFHSVCVLDPKTLKSGREPSLLEIFELMQRQHWEVMSRLNGSDTQLVGHTSTLGTNVTANGGSPGRKSQVSYPGLRPSMVSFDASVMSQSYNSSVYGGKRRPATYDKRKRMKDFRTVSDLESKHVQSAKEKNLQANVRHVSDATQAEPFQSCVERLVGSVKFEAFFAAAILGSSLLLGIQVEYAAGQMTEDVPLVLEVVNNLFAFVFLVELIIRFLAKGLRALWFDPDWIWYWLDTVIVLS